MSNGLGLMNRPTDAVYIYNVEAGLSSYPDERSGRRFVWDRA